MLREQGEIAEAEAAAARHEQLLLGLPQPSYRSRVPMLRATTAMLDGDFDAAERHASELHALVEAGARGGLTGLNLLHMSIAHLRGDPASIAPHASRIEATTGKVDGARGFLAWLYAATGRRDQARPILEEITQLPFAFPWVLLGGEAAVLSEDQDLSARVYPLLRHQISMNSFFWGVQGLVVFGPTQRVAGDVARFLGRVDEAREWYREAVAIGERMRSKGIVTLVRRRMAALGASGGSCEREAARSAEASETVSTPRSIESPTGRPRERAITDIEWIVRSSTGIVVHLKDSKGLLYLSHLLAAPGQELHVTQLAELSVVSGDASAVLDGRAKAEYKRRLEELRDELEEATRFADMARAESVQAEIDAIAEQLAAAVGLGGRDRKVGSHVERVRINVQRRLRDAIHRIGEVDPALGRYLTATVKTGTFCMFSPL